MVYSTESAKWKAYQFSDPFAAGSFFVCNKINKYFCRPDCDARPRTNLKAEIKFVNLPAEAVEYGYVACESCDPVSLPTVDINLLVRCVSTINKLIGFLLPLLDENEEKNNQKIKENILELKKTNEEQMMAAFDGSAGRRCLLPAINYDGRYLKDFENLSLSKNDLDHYRLVDLACRHLALAAAMNIFQPAQKGLKLPEDGNSPGADGSAGGSRKRRRRGGVLGFKELAAKSKLLAWHFHRVFKSVTGLTPKNYGDKCWEFLKMFKDLGDRYTPYTPPSSHTLPPASYKRAAVSAQSSPNKRVKVETADDIILPMLLVYEAPLKNSGLMGDLLSLQPKYQAPQFKYQMPEQATFAFPQLDTFNFEEQEQDLSRAFSAPDLTAFGNSRPSLFNHAKQFEQKPVQESPLLEEMGQLQGLEYGSFADQFQHTAGSAPFEQPLVEDSLNIELPTNFQYDFSSVPIESTPLFDNSQFNLSLSPEMLSVNIGL